MKVALYMCRVGEGWSMMLSLDIRVDVAWWLEGGCGRHVLRWLLLDKALPLSQASWLVEHYEMERGMDQWGKREWQNYLARKLDVYELASGETEARKGIAGKAGSTAVRGNQVGGMPEPYPAGQWAQAERDAALLAERISGRQLLAAEAEALLADTAQPPKEWRAAAQARALARAAEYHSRPRRACHAPSARVAWTRAERAPLPPLWQRSQAARALRCLRPGGVRLLRGLPRARAQPCLCAAATQCSARGRATTRRSTAWHGLGPHRRRARPVGAKRSAERGRRRGACVFGPATRRGWAGAVFAVGRDRGRQDRNDIPSTPTYIGSWRTSFGRYAAQGCGAGTSSASGQSFSGHLARYSLRGQ